MAHMKQEQRNLIQVGDKFVLVSGTATKIIKCLGGNPESAFTYAALSKETKVAKQSLYVFTQRLEKAGVVTKSTLDGQVVISINKVQFVVFESI